MKHPIYTVIHLVTYSITRLHSPYRGETTMKKHTQQEVNHDNIVIIVWGILLITGIIAVLILMAADARADIITHNGAEMKVIFDKELTAEQLQLVKEIAKDQQTAAETLTKLDADAKLKEAKAEQDSELARQVVFYAFILVAVLIVILLVMMRRQSRPQPAPSITYYHDAPVIDAQRVQALPEQRDFPKLASTHAMMRREG